MVGARNNTYGLLDKQWMFVQEYLTDFNAVQAALRAGYSKRTVDKQGSQLLGNPRISSAIRSEQGKRLDRTKLVQEEVLNEIRLIAHSDISHYNFDAYGNLSLTPDAPKNALRAVQAMKKRTIPTKAGIAYEAELKLWSKTAALDMAGKHLDLFHGPMGADDIQRLLQDVARVMRETLLEYLEEPMAREILKHISAKSQVLEATYRVMQPIPQLAAGAAD